MPTSQRLVILLPSSNAWRIRKFCSHLYDPGVKNFQNRQLVEKGRNRFVYFRPRLSSVAGSEVGLSKNRWLEDMHRNRSHTLPQENPEIHCGCKKAAIRCEQVSDESEADSDFQKRNSMLHHVFHLLKPSGSKWCVLRYSEKEDVSGHDRDGGQNKEAGKQWCGVAENYRKHDIVQPSFVLHLNQFGNRGIKFFGRLPKRYRLRCCK
jgi:hypothetical protein